MKNNHCKKHQKTKQNNKIKDIAKMKSQLWLQNGFKRKKCPGPTREQHFNRRMRARRRGTEGVNAPRSDPKLRFLKALCIEPFFKNVFPTKAASTFLQKLSEIWNWRVCKALKARWKQQIENEIRKAANSVFSLGVQDRKIAQVMDEKQNFEGPKNGNKTLIFVLRRYERCWKSKMCFLLQWGAWFWKCNFWAKVRGT